MRTLLLSWTRVVTDSLDVREMIHEQVDSGQDEAEGGSQNGMRDAFKATPGTLKIADSDVLDPVSSWALIAEMDQ